MELVLEVAALGARGGDRGTDHQDGGDHPVDPWDQHEQGMLDTIGFELDGDAFVESRNILFGGFEAPQLHRQQEAVVFLHPPVERQDQIGALAAQLPVGEIGHRLGRASPSISARSIARPDTPKTSEATLASLMLAVSKSFRSRLRSAAWLSTTLRR